MTSIIILDNNINKDVVETCKKSSKAQVYLAVEYDAVIETQKEKENIEKLVNELNKVLLKKFYKKVFNYDMIYNDDNLLNLQIKCEKDILNIISNDVSNNDLSIKNLNFLLTKITYLTHLTPSDTDEVVDKIKLKIKELKLCEQQYAEALAYLNNEEYLKAYQIFIKNPSYKYSSIYINRIIEKIKMDYVYDLEKVSDIEDIKKAHDYLKKFKNEELKTIVKLYYGITNEYNYICSCLDYTFLHEVGHATKYGSIYTKIKDFVSSLNFDCYLVIEQLIKEKIKELVEKLMISTRYDLENTKEFRNRVECLKELGKLIDIESSYEKLALLIDKYKFNERVELHLLNCKIKSLEILNEYYNVSIYIDNALSNKKELEEKIRLEDIQKAKEEKLRKEAEEKQAMKLRKKEKAKKLIKVFFIGLLILIGVAFVGFLIFRGIIEIIDLSTIFVKPNCLVIDWMKGIFNIN